MFISLRTTFRLKLIKQKNIFTFKKFVVLMKFSRIKQNRILPRSTSSLPKANTYGYLRIIYIESTARFSKLFYKWPPLKKFKKSWPLNINDVMGCLFKKNFNAK